MRTTISVSRSSRTARARKTLAFPTPCSLVGVAGEIRDLPIEFLTLQDDSGPALVVGGLSILPSRRRSVRRARRAVAAAMASVRAARRDSMKAALSASREASSPSMKAASFSFSSIVCSTSQTAVSTPEFNR
jgi:hypothetical protein